MNQSTDCCTHWDGVACDHSNGRVVSIIRPGVFDGPDPDESPCYAEMHGTISPSLGNLEFLLVLDLTSLKFLTGSIPLELGKLSHVTTLSLAGNRLNGTIPALFKNLRKLNQLSLSSNLLSGSVSNFIFQDMSSLTYLGLYENQLSGEIPSSVVKLVSLQHLDLHGNNFTGSIPSEIGSLKDLIDLNFSESFLYPLENYNTLTGSISSSSIGGTGLQRLFLENNMITGEIPDSIGNLTNLAELSLKNNRFTGKIPLSFGNLKNVYGIDLSRNGLSGPIPSELAKLKYLEILDLSFNPLNLVNIPTWLSEMKHLSQLYVAGTGLVGELPEWLTTMGLRYLDVSSNALAGEFPRWIGNMPSLFSLNLSNNSFHSAIPIEFKTILTVIELDLHWNNFTGGLDYIFAKRRDGGMGQYRHLDLSDNMFAGPIDEDTGNLEVMQFIRKLVLSNNPFGGSIPKSLGKLRSLMTLKLANNGLTGTIPSELSNSTLLGSIVLSNNNLNGGIPSGLMNLRLLEELDVSHNMLTGEIPRHNATIPAASFEGNSGLCGSPLPPCNTS
ncbi:DNA damage-repair/toleration protein DRT100-like [Papaver somniferum]|uniref:DNA damage-repair/toleration protein DRT100-like n=1 Tax=Papaver somniferum TaxID=3469 RepID=UPI000E6FD38A|nr:DNA damage-repair/toleration protein DRT100-like [Papaver somniferum]